MNEIADRQLQRARAFDKSAITAIYDSFHPKIYRYIYRQVGEVEMSRDLTAEVFRRFLQAIKKGNGPENQLQAWLYRTAHNIVIDFYRRQQHRNHLELIDTIPGADSELEWVVDQHLLEQTLRKAIHALTPEQQQVITLKFLEGFSNGEVAEIMKKPVGAVKSLQHRALNALQRHLTPSREAATL